eukprot:3746822-Pyramimonas_sp.AAC.1
MSLETPEEAVQEHPQSQSEPQGQEQRERSRSPPRRQRSPPFRRGQAMATAMMNQIDFHLSLVQRAMLAMSLSYGANFTSTVLLPVTREFAGNRDPPPGANDIFNDLY